jgi:hypothetical protein
MRGITPVELQGEFHLQQTRGNRGNPAGGVFARRSRRQGQG